MLANSWAGQQTRRVSGEAVAFTVTIMSCFGDLAVQAKAVQFSSRNAMSNNNETGYPQFIDRAK
tara:strand:- start:635 stop:826 length:192 start_codon:yes stop_codon:yes gene_type:complete